MKYLSFALILISFVAGTLGFGVLDGAGALVCRALFVAAFVAFGVVLAAARIRAKTVYDDKPQRPG